MDAHEASGVPKHAGTLKARARALENIRGIPRRVRSRPPSSPKAMALRIPDLLQIPAKSAGCGTLLVDEIGNASELPMRLLPPVEQIVKCLPPVEGSGKSRFGEGERLPMFGHVLEKAPLEALLADHLRARQQVIARLDERRLPGLVADRAQAL